MVLPSLVREKVIVSPALPAEPDMASFPPVPPLPPLSEKVRGVDDGAVKEYSLPAAKVIVQTFAAHTGVGFAVIAAIEKVAPSVAPTSANSATSQVRIEIDPLFGTSKNLLIALQRYFKKFRSDEHFERR
jgi:hypothetical protein